jgi:hemolysin III
MTKGDKDYDAIADLKFFRDELLYCEGLLKPAWRGHMHKYVFFVYLFSFAILWYQSETWTEKIGTIMFAFCNMMSFGISYCYHCLEWSPRYEIYMERLDHLAIFTNTANHITQLCLFALRSRNRMFIIAIAWVISMYGVYKIFTRVRSVHYKAMCGAIVVLALPEMIQHMSTVQWNWFLVTWGQNAVGMIAYATKSPNIWPEYFGYHEVMHLLTSLAGLSAIFLQYYLLHDFEADRCVVHGSDSMRHMFTEAWNWVQW